LYSAFGAPHGWRTFALGRVIPKAPYGIAEGRLLAKSNPQDLSFMARRSSTIESPTIIPRLLGVKAAAQYLGATVWAARCLAWQQEIPFLKIGGRILFDRVDLDRFIDSQKMAVR
jgi:excisionase family DNA binding protein